MRRAPAGERLERNGGPVRDYIGAAVALVIMGRALDAGSPFHDNGFSNRPIGHTAAGGGQVIMGRAVGPGSPARSRGVRPRCRRVQVIMGRALKVGYPLRGNGFSNRPVGHAPAGSDRVCMAAARSAGSLVVRWHPGLTDGRALVEQWPGDHGACARCGIPVPRQRILESTNWERASAERPGDHGACGRVRKPGEARAYEPRCRWVPGDHGACAQGRIPVTWQWILESTDWARASGERQGVHGGRAVRGLASLCGGTRA